MKGIVYWTPYICMHSASVYEELGKRLHVIIACKSLEYGTFGGLNMKNVEIVHVEEEDDVDILIQRTQKYVHINQALKTYPEIEIFWLCASSFTDKRMLCNGCEYGTIPMVDTKRNSSKTAMVLSFQYRSG